MKGDENDFTEFILGNLEARGGIEPPIKVLQTFALPLGDRALVLLRPAEIPSRTLASTRNKLPENKKPTGLQLAVGGNFL